MSNEIIIARPDTEALETDVMTAIARAEQVQITTAPEHGMALEMIKALRDREKRITDHFEPSRKALDVAKKEVLTARDKLVNPLEAARGVLSKKAVTYQQEQEQIAREAREKAEAEAREKQRIADEAAKKAEADRLVALEAALDEGDDEKAFEILEADPEPVEIVAPVAVEAPALAAVKGAGTRTTWSAEVTDKMALLRYVVENPEWSFLIEASLPSLNRIAVAEKENMNIPGVKAVPSTSIVTR